MYSFCFPLVHGRGYRNIDQANTALIAGNITTRYLGKNYPALGMGYDFTPLLNGSFLAISNWTDHSRLLAMNLMFSLSDESELSLAISLPHGHEPEGMQIKSEFGSSPVSVILDYRLYF
ncbi:MAG: hypothetical protein KKE17_13215 [Proteobacteria bacterium]|nr:hypothetical protein [Pseudomonadota bacterium]MBU1710955.1 hypothetical protein [Pseudomonadota bacterium]